MSRSDSGKPRKHPRLNQEIDVDHNRDELGPFLVCLSGYAPSRNKKTWKIDNHGNWEEN